MDRDPFTSSSSMVDQSTISLGQSRIEPGKRAYVIGDIHGCLEELKRLLALIEADLSHHPIDTHRIIFIGDYVDRGPDSKGVIDLLIGLQEDARPLTCLLGNHEQKLIAACRGMDQQSLPGFIKYGGLETLASYGLTTDDIHNALGDMPGPDLLEKFATTVTNQVGQKQVEFLSKLATCTLEGDYYFCHAGVDPEVALKDQSAHDLIWMREPFLSWTTPLEKVIVHGHTPKSGPEWMPHRINTDTSCVYGQALTAVVLEEDQQRILQVRAQRDHWTRQ
jgi:serine/threonine protein phosphatase 1